MVDSAWQPLGSAGDYSTTFHEGIPEWASKDVWAWISARTRARPSGGLFGWDQRLIEEFDQRRRRVSEGASQMILLGPTAMRAGWDDENDVIPFIDFLLAKGPGSGDASDRALESVLARCGSAWRVGTRAGCRGLQRRVPEGVQQSADQAMTAPSYAGARLAEAWHSVYGLRPNPTHAYSMAIKAVEDAAIPVVVPRQAGATLGHVIGQLANDGDWSLPLTHEDPAAPTAETVIRMCKGLWKGQSDRHGGDPTAPKSVGQNEAEAAVHLAVFLVQGFTSGLIARR